VGSQARKRFCTSLGGERSEGRIPRALSARNKADPVWAGASRYEGEQTLKAERSGLGTPADSGSPGLARAEGNESPREVPTAAAARLRDWWARLWRKTKLDERMSPGRLTVARSVRRGKTAQPGQGPTAQRDRRTDEAIPRRAQDSERAVNSTRVRRDCGNVIASSTETDD
jgi:hypothetical protein